MRKMFWIDLEMTGLDENIDKILEVAVVITDLNFQALETYHRIVYQPNEVLENMGEWCKKTHGKSGLTAAVPNGTPLPTVEKELIELTAKHFSANEKIVLCGNSVGNDKRFVDKHMPEFAKKLHYRLVDVTSFKEVFRSKYNIVMQKADGHRALDDIQESIKELQHYLAYVQVPAGTALA
ncbi:MAG: oligoribonuclease [Bdellovibrionota bacterium]